METQVKTVSQEVAELLAKGEAIIKEGEALLLQKNGQNYPLTEWLTIKEYTKRFDIKSTNVVTNWIRRGIIPAENILHIPELNDIRLIKAVPYHE